MSDSQPVRPAQRFTLNAVPPVRPLAIAAVVVVLAAGLLVLWRAVGLPVVVGVLGVVLLVLGLALAVAALVLTARLRTEVTLDDEAITVLRGGHRRSVRWADVSEVKLQHPRLSLLTGDAAGSLVLVDPRSPGTGVFAALVAEISARLDHDRGYRD